MYRKIAVANSESAEAQLAFGSTIQWAKSLGSELDTITVMSEFPSYTAIARTADPSQSHVLVVDSHAWWMVQQ